MLDIVELLSVRELKHFSATCRWFRQASKPHLFSDVRIDVAREVFTGNIFRASSDVWSYVRRITFGGMWCHDYDVSRPDLGDMEHPLTDFLCRMPLLDSIDVSESRTIGIPWDGIRALLSVPRIRHFSLRICPHRGRPFPSDAEGFAVAPLESFEYVLKDYMHLQRHYVGEMTLLRFILLQSAASLMHLRLPLGLAPLSVMSSLHWPQLRRLYLKGEAAVGESTPPVISLVSHMPQLRSLTFLPALLRHSQRVILEPPQLACDAFPCPELDELTVAHPDPNDAFYPHLLPTLRRLTLQCWPRHYLYRRKNSGRALKQLAWQSPILSSSELLLLLEKTRLPELELLDVEYVADAQEERLLHRLPDLFPGLEMLTIYRYRGADTDEVPVVGVRSARLRSRSLHSTQTWIARQFSSYDRLRMLRIHFDFPQPTNPKDDQFQSLQCAAMEIARHIDSPAIRYVCALQREGLKNFWLPWRVDRDRNGAVRWTLDTTLTAFRGVSMSDDDGPYLFINPDHSASAEP
ncbi:hypothetical protein FKP32DRAFT_1154840 [Trametes sanguinea]|nr:hypothetical protein FKP32DRAFT_1154840 [Trametes sanguinea]